MPSCSSFHQARAGGATPGWLTICGSGKACGAHTSTASPDSEKVVVILSAAVSAGSLHLISHKRLMWKPILLKVFLWCSQAYNLPSGSYSSVARESWFA